VDLQRLAVSVRRRRRLWVSAGLLGLVAGGLLAILVPSPPTATAKLLVVHQDDSPSDSGTLIRTDVAVLQTTRIAAAALKSLNINERPEDFLTKYQSAGLTNNVLQVTVKGSSDGDAVARAQALANAFIADHAQRIQTAADAQAQALLNQRNQAQAELTKVDASIAATSAAGSRANPTDLESLYARRAELTAQISDFGNRAGQAATGAPQIAAGTQIVDAARPVPRSLLKTGATNGAVGLAIGLVAGLALAAVASVVRDRPVLRREIAANLGASVIGQLPAPHRGPARLWRRSRAVAERKRVAATLVRAVGADPGTTAALALNLAEELAFDGPVVVVDDLPSQNLRKLTGKTQSPIRILGADDRAVGQHRRQIGVGSVAPGTAWTDIEYLGSETVLVVRAGFANSSWLHTVARQLADCQIPVIGVVLVGPDPRDHSDGTLWDGLHTALRGRARRGASSAAEAALVSRSENQVLANGGDHSTKQFAPVRAAAPENGNGSHSGDLPTKQFAPVWPKEPEDLEVY
jgi:capsular polysaccharide biosynthesis protein